MAKATPQNPTDIPTAGLTLGPLLGVETTPTGETRYTCCVAWAEDRKPKLTWQIADMSVPFTLVADLTAGTFWRAEWLAPAGTTVDYQVLDNAKPVAGVDGRTQWTFHLAPPTHTGFRFVYASCNGFSSAKLLANADDPYVMWAHLAVAHRDQPHHALLMGGDQIYADALWEQDWMREFTHQSVKEQIKAPVTAEQEANLDRFYERLYLRQWRRPEVARMLAVLPSAMMWDDHDIFDGWGSFPDGLQASKVYHRVFAAARLAFGIFQQRGRPAGEFLSPDACDYVLKLADTTFLVLDHRSNRSRTRVMSDRQRDALRAWLGRCEARRLLVLTGVPVVYRNFNTTEAIMRATPWQEELEDDLLDHWSAREHQRERVQFIYTLVTRQAEIHAARETKDCQWVLLSGDVHVGGVGVVWDSVRDAGLYQIISSGIAHPPPSWLEWQAITAGSSDEPEILGDGDLKAELLTATGAAANYLRTRNFVLAEVGTDDRLWFEWRCEDRAQPVFSV